MYVSEPEINPYTGKSHRVGVEMTLRTDGLKARHFKKFAMETVPNLVNRTSSDVSFIVGSACEGREG